MKQTNIIFGLCALLAFQLLFVAGYVAAEHTFYYWDLGMYHAFVRDLYETSGFAAQSAKFIASFSRNYNLLFSFPGLLGESFFGPSRVVYIVSNFLFYCVPLELAAAALFRKLFQQLSFEKALLIVFLAAPTVLPFWTPLFEGFPDHAAALFVAAGLFLILRPQERIRDKILAGLCLGLAIVLRRHFAYAAVALFLTLSLRAPHSVKKAIPYFLKLFAMGSALSLLVCALEPSYVAEVAVTNFRALYKSYEEPFPVFLTYIFSTFGFLSLSLSVAAFVLLSFPEKLGFKRKDGQAVFSKETVETARTLSLFAVIWIFVWGLGPSQLGPHHLMPILPLFVLLGTASALFLLYESPLVETDTPVRQKRWARFLLISLSTLLGIQFLWGSLLAPSAVFTKVPSSPGFFAEPHPPLRRADYQTLIRLARDLIQLAKPDDKIVIVGSSALWNEDLVRAIFTDELRNPSLLRQFLWAPEIDHHQAPPFQVSEEGTLFVVPTPAQYHLDPKGQTVVTALQNQFPPTGARAKLYTRLPKTYALDQGVTLTLWRREGQTPEAVEETNNIIAKATNQRQRWSVLASPASVQREKEEGRDSVLFVFSPRQREASLLFNQRVGGVPLRLSFDSFHDLSCENAALDLLVEKPDGEVLSSLSVPLLMSSSHTLRTFTPEKDGFFVLRLTTEPTTYCRFVLENLSLDSVQGE